MFWQSIVQGELLTFIHLYFGAIVCPLFKDGPCYLINIIYSTLWNKVNNGKMIFYAPVTCFPIKDNESKYLSPKEIVKM